MSMTFCYHTPDTTCPNCQPKALSAQDLEAVAREGAEAARELTERMRRMGGGPRTKPWALIRAKRHIKRLERELAHKNKLLKDLGDKLSSLALELLVRETEELGLYDEAFDKNEGELVGASAHATEEK